jgi:hypothetical protein
MHEAHRATESEKKFVRFTDSGKKKAGLLALLR